MSSTQTAGGTRKISARKRMLFGLVVGLSSAVLAFIAVELGLHWIAKNHLGVGKLYQPDPVAGWRPLSNLDLVRKNPDGQRWRVVTDDEGHRNVLVEPFNPSRSLLILGDSLAFGEGVGVADRFDTLIAKAHLDLSILNVGVPGYGTFQQILRGRPYFDELQAGDVVLLITCSNDFMDVMRSYFAGRDKPYITSDETGALTEVLPGITVRGWLRDKSYIASKLIAYFFTNEQFSPEVEKKAVRLYYAMVRHYLMPLSERGIRVLLAYYDYTGHPDTNSDLINVTFGTLCETPGVDCLNLNEGVDRQKGSSHIIWDGHWSAAGNSAVADLLIPALNTQ